MSQVIAATYVDGVLKPEQALSLEPGTRVRLIVDRWEEGKAKAKLAFDDLDRVCDEFPIESKGPRLTREQLYDRR